MTNSKRGGIACAVLSLVSWPAAAALDTNAAIDRARAQVAAHASTTMMSSQDAFGVRAVVTDADGARHVRFDRRYKGLPVIGGDLVVHLGERGQFRGASLTQRSPLSLDVRPTLSAAAAIARAEAQFRGTRSERAAAASLAVYARGSTPRLVHDVLLHGVGPDGTPSERHVAIDARTGAVLDQWDDIHTAEAAGVGHSLFSGSVDLTTDSVRRFYEMLDPSRGDHYVADMKNRQFGSGRIFSDADNEWGDATLSDPATVAVDAALGQNMTWDFFLSSFGRNGIADNGNGAFSRVHYGRNYVNAFWSDSCFCMTYGDGNGSSYNPLVSLDIAGHEMTHGVTSNTAGLIYSGESGGLNEAMSDIFGTLVEYYAGELVYPPNYLIGERIYAVNDGVDTPTQALRFMFKPHLDGISPDCYFNGIGNMDVHYSSGVANHFFYLLAEGAVVPAGFDALSDADLVCNGNTEIVGIGREAAAQILYRALTVYLTSSSAYAQARSATLDAAEDLFGPASDEYLAVAAAWSAVGVD